MVLPAVAAYFYFVEAQTLPVWGQRLSYILGKLVFVLPLVCHFIVERRHAPQWPRTRDGLGISLAFGLLVAAGTMLLYWFALRDAPPFLAAMDSIRAKLTGFGLDSPVSYLLFAGFVSLLHSGLEEYYWRWFVFGRLQEFLGFLPAAIMASVAFMAHHVIILGLYFGWLSLAQIGFSLGVAVGGFVWCWIYYRSHSLLGPWLSHAIIDAAIFMIGYDLALAN